MRNPSLELSTNFDFKVSNSDFFEGNLTDEFFNNEHLKFYINSLAISSKTDFLNKLKEDPDDIYDTSIIFTQDFLNNTDEPVLYFYNDKSINDFFTLLSTRYLLKNFEEIENKIDLRCETSTITNFESSLMTLNSNRVRVINENTKSFFELFHNKDVPVLVIPGSIPSSDVLKLKFNNILQGQLDQLANNSSGSSYRFIGKNTLTFDTASMPDNKDQKILVQQLEETLTYVFENPKSVDQKLTFYRKVLIDKLSKDTTIKLQDLDEEFLEESLHETNVIFDAFQDGEISVFIKEKKEIIKEYMSISQEVLRSVNHLKNNLQRSLIALMVLFVSNFALKSKGITDINDFRMILIAAIVFVIIIIILHFINDRPIKGNITNKRRVFNEHFKFLSSKSKSVKNAIETTIDDEVKILNRILCFSVTLYFIFLLFLLFLLSDSYSHSTVHWIFNFLKMVSKEILIILG